MWRPKEGLMGGELSRRAFLRTAAAGVAGLAAGVPPSVGTASQRQDHLEHRMLGKTGLRVSLLGLGCVALGSSALSQSDGEAIVHTCLDGGITYIDCASTYGDAEVKVGLVMRDRRSEVVLATKILERDRDSAWREFHRSLERLNSSRVDILQLHAINRLDDLDRIMAPDGAFHAALRALDEGLCDHIGITGHTRVEVLVEALRRYEFATTLVPISSTDRLVSDFGETLFPLAQKGNFGVIAMKVLAAGRVTNHVRDSLTYAWSHPVSTAVIGMGSVEEVKNNIAVAREFRPMSEAEQRALEERTRRSATTDILWWKRR